MEPPAPALQQAAGCVPLNLKGLLFRGTNLKNRGQACQLKNFLDGLVQAKQYQSLLVVARFHQNFHQRCNSGTVDVTDLAHVDNQPGCF